MTIDKDELKEALRDHLTITIHANKHSEGKVEIQVRLKFDGFDIDYDKDHFWIK